MTRTSLVPDLSRKAWTILLGDAFSSVGGGLVLPFLIVYLHRVRGIELDVAALAVSTLAVAGLAGGPVGGALSDKIGARPTLILGLLVSAAGSVLVAMIHSPWQAFLATAVIGVGQAAFWPSLHSLLVSVVRPDQRSAVFSVHYAMLNAGIGIGGIAGGLIANIDNPRSFEILYLLDAATFIVFIAVLLVMGRRERAEPSIEEVQESTRGTYRDVLRDRTFVKIFLLMIVMVIVGYSQLESGFPAYSTGEGGISTRALGFTFAANTFVIVMAQLVVLKRLAGHRRTRAISILCLLWAGAWMVTLASGHLGGGSLAAVGFGFAMVLFALGETILSPTVPAMVNDLAPDHLRGRYNATYSLAWSFGHMIGPAIAGLLLDRGDGDLLFVFLAGGAVATGFAALRMERSLPPSANLIADNISDEPVEPTATAAQPAS